MFEIYEAKYSTVKSIQCLNKVSKIGRMAYPKALEFWHFLGQYGHFKTRDKVWSDILLGKL